MRKLTKADLEAKAALIEARWQENNGQITRAEVKEITGRVYAGLYAAFNRLGVSARIPNDTQRFAWSENAKKLNASGEPIVDADDVPRILGMPRPKAIAAYWQAQKHYSVPQLSRSKSLDMPDMPSVYSEGLQVMSARKLVDGKVAYEVR